MQNKRNISKYEHEIGEYWAVAQEQSTCIALQNPGKSRQRTDK